MKIIDPVTVEPSEEVAAAVEVRLGTSLMTGTQRHKHTSFTATLVGISCWQRRH